MDFSSSNFFGGSDEGSSFDGEDRAPDGFNWSEKMKSGKNIDTDTRDALEQLANAEVDEIEVKPDLTLLDEPEVNFILKRKSRMQIDPLAGYQPNDDLSDTDQEAGAAATTYHQSKRFTAEDLKCKFCDRTFQFPWIVAVHMNTHTGKRPYRCEVCGKSFSSSGTLSNHRTIHKKLKPFQCSYCDKSFGRRYQLQTHELIHTGEKGYHRCGRCNESFRKKQECTEHEASCTRTERVEPQIRYGKLKRRRQKITSESSAEEAEEAVDAKVNLHLDVEIKEENIQVYY